MQRESAKIGRVKKLIPLVPRVGLESDRSKTVLETGGGREGGEEGGIVRTLKVRRDKFEQLVGGPIKKSPIKHLWGGGGEAQRGEKHSRVLAR